ncbi:MAG: GNAT family N-acetyltransferase [Pseudonocardiaceae bacterium]
MAESSIHMLRVWHATQLSDRLDTATGSVREVTPGDVQTLGKLFWEAFGQGGVDGFDYALAAEAEARDTLAGKWGPVVWEASLLALIQGEPAAASIVVFDDAHEMRPLLAFLVTNPDHQRRGIGSQLVHETIIRLNGREICELHLAVDRDNPARFLYERLGFAQA